MTPPPASRAPPQLCWGGGSETAAPFLRLLRSAVARRTGADHAAAGALSAGDQLHPAQPDATRDAVGLLAAAGELPTALVGFPPAQFGLGADQAVVLDGAAAAPDRAFTGAAAERPLAAARGAAHGVPDPHGAAADRRRHHLEGDLHARHQPDAWHLPQRRLERAGADHRSRLG